MIGRKWNAVRKGHYSYIKYGKQRMFYVVFMCQIQYMMITRYFILCFTVLAFGRAQAQEAPGMFYVTIKGDTVRNFQSAVILGHHPQSLSIRVNGKNRVVPADSIVFLRVYESHISAKGKGMYDYTVMRMPSTNKKRPYCAHFIRPLYSYMGADVMYTPFCQQCGNLYLYLVKNNQYITRLRKRNFTEKVNQYFAGCTQLVNYAQSTKYSPSRFLKHLRKGELKTCDGK